MDSRKGVDITCGHAEFLLACSFKGECPSVMVPIFVLLENFQKSSITSLQVDIGCDAPEMGIIYTEGVLRLSHLHHSHHPSELPENCTEENKAVSGSGHRQPGLGYGNFAAGAVGTVVGFCFVLVLMNLFLEMMCCCSVTQSCLTLRQYEKGKR